jgi:rhamnose transport system permease protein
MKLKLEREWPALAALAVLYLFLAMAAPSFYHFENLRDLALANVSVLLVAAGMTLVIVIAQIDISVGSLFAVTSVAYGVLVKQGLPLLLAPFAAVLIGALLGAVNGGLISFVRAPSIVVTLATMIVWRE